MGTSWAVHGCDCDSVRQDAESREVEVAIHAGFFGDGRRLR